ncbi:MAG: CocE/NonD family hydrolase [Planctomycetota bacterium]|nr:CocE/NonD family hydrolase [Planctomycetota bacterium]
MRSRAIAWCCLLAAGLALLLSAPVIAQQPDGKGEGENDGIARLTNLIDRFDADKDSTLSASEQAELLKWIADNHDARSAKIARAVLTKADSNADGSISEAEWEKVSKKAGERTTAAADKETVMVPMTDGVKLATDIYLPEGEGPFPVVLMRTPYGKSGPTKGAVDTSGARQWTSLGYAYVAQDMRGRFDSEGENVPFIGCGWGEHKDGVETIAWVRKQTWCNGKVGTFGSSASGITQNLMAGAVPEGLTAQYIQVAAASLYHHAYCVGGALRKCQVENWSTGHGFNPKALDGMREHPSYDEHWKNSDSTTKHSVMNVPAVHFGGWFDTFQQGTIDSFVGRQNGGAEGAKGKQKLVIGPWDHGGWRKDDVGELTFPDCGIPKRYDATRWFEYHLKGVDNGMMNEPAIAYYVLGDANDPKAPGNQWRYVNDWPVPSTATRYYFCANKTLTATKPDSAKDGVLEYTFDPESPCPTIGGCNLTIPRGPRDQAKVESRTDVLVFTTDPLTEPLEVTGRVAATVCLASSAVDTDLSVRLCDVYPDGKSYLMAEGMLRARYRGGFEKPVLMEPGSTVEATVDMWSISIIFNKGHRIRVTVTSSNYPRFDLNPGTGKPWSDDGEKVKQTNKIHCGAGGVSHITLPVVAAGSPNEARQPDEGAKEK